MEDVEIFKKFYKFSTVHAFHNLIHIFSQFISYFINVSALLRYIKLSPLRMHGKFLGSTAQPFHCVINVPVTI
jgi:hypothetical protein